MKRSYSRSGKESVCAKAPICHAKRGFFSARRLHGTVLLLLLLISTVIASCVPKQPQNIDSICAIFDQQPSWYTYAKRTEQRWGVPVELQMAIMHQESSFIGNARPPRKKLLGIVPWTRSGSDYGFAQAINPTWQEYKAETGRTLVRRSSFADASDFVGWYVDKAHRRLDIPKNNAYDMYLAYNVGMGGYERGHYNSHPWVRDAARKVAERAGAYKRELLQCRTKLERRRSWW